MIQLQHENQLTKKPEDEATKKMNTPDREHPPEHPEHPVFIKS